jgi:hypothetical protein
MPDVSWIEMKMSSKRKHITSIHKKAKRGFMGYPIGTIAFYGPDAYRASKVTVGIVEDETGNAIKIKRWNSEKVDVRIDAAIIKSIEKFIRENEVRSVAMTDRIIGCPHEEGIDYPEGQVCPECPYWANRDRFTGEKIKGNDSQSS